VDDKLERFLNFIKLSEKNAVAKIKN